MAAVLGLEALSANSSKANAAGEAIYGQSQIIAAGAACTAGLACM